MKSKIYSSDYVKNTAKGQLWIPAFLALGFLMAFPVAELLMLGNWTGIPYSQEKIAYLYENLWRDGFMSTGFVVVMIAAAVNGVNGFWYLYSARKIDFYHSLPVRRSQMFWHKAFVGILFYLIPYAAMEFFALCIGAMRGYFSMKLMGMALSMAAMHFLLYLLIYFSTVLGVCITGNILMGALTLTGIFVYGEVLGALLKAYYEIFFCTFDARDSYGIIRFLEEYFSPVLFARTFLRSYGKGQYTKMLAILLLVIVVITVLAYYAYLKRPSENTGKAMIYDWVGTLLKFMVVIPGGLGVGMIFYLLPGKEERIIWWIFGMVLGTVLFQGITNVLYQMDFRKFFAKKIHLLLASAAVAVLAVCFQRDLFQFDLYLPEKEKLETVNFDFEILSGERSYYIEEAEDGSYRNSIRWSDKQAAYTKPGEIGEETYQTLKDIISIQKSCTDGETKMGRGLTGDRWYSIQVKYGLKSGREVYREYLMEPERLSQLLEALYKEGTLKEKKYSFLCLENQYLESVDATFINGENYSIFQNQKAKYAELLDALRADVADAEAAELLEQPCALLHLMFRFPETLTADRVIPNEENLTPRYCTVFISPSFKRTVAILEETGYPLSRDEISLKSVSVTYPGKEISSDSKEEETVVYRKEEELKELKEALIPIELICSWKSCEQGLEVIYTFQDGRADGYGTFLTEALPQFIIDKIEETGAGKYAATMEEEAAEEY